MLSCRLGNELNRLIHRHIAIGKPDEKKFKKRELEILHLSCQELKINEIAEKLNIKVPTVRSYQSVLILKTNSKNMIDVILYAIKNGYYDINNNYQE